MTGARRWADHAPVVVLGAVCAAFIARTAFVLNGKLTFSLFDDAMISMRFARNLAEGHGLVWNAGQAPVEGYSNFLWTVWMALIHLVRIPENLTSLGVMLTGAGLLIANAYLVRAIAVEAGARDVERRVAVWATCLFYPLIFWTLRGMEVGLVTTLLSALVLHALRYRHSGSHRSLAFVALASAGLILTRTETAVTCLFVAAWLGSEPAGRRAALRVVAPAVVATLVGLTVFRIAYYGDALPNTYALKLGGFPLDRRLGRGVSALTATAAIHLAVPLFLAAYGAARWRADRCAVLLAGVVAIQVAYSVYVGGDAWESFGFANRFVTPAAPSMLVLAAMGVGELRAAPARHRRRVLLLGAALATALATVAVAIQPSTVLTLFAGTSSEDLVAGGFLLLAVACIAVAAPMLRARIPAAAGACALLIGLGSGIAWFHWAGRGAEYTALDQALARYGAGLRDATEPGATIAVALAGAIPYFDHRPSVDLLGKSDRHVARLAPTFTYEDIPGHTKWDYAYSVGRLRPDVVAQGWFGVDEQRRLFPEYEYEPIGLAWVQRDSASVRRDRLAAAIERYTRDVRAVFEPK